MLRIVDITAPDICNGNGVRVTLWVAGCTNHCKGCHNQWTWDFEQGTIFKEHKEEIFAKLANWLDREYIEGLTFSGGDPMTQDKDALKEELEIIKWVRKNYPTKNIWLYTGLTLESINENPKFSFWAWRTHKKIMKIKNAQRDVLKNIDILVDGPYIEKLRDVAHCPFRGSTNQRIIEISSIFK